MIRGGLCETLVTRPMVKLELRKCPLVRLRRGQRGGQSLTGNRQLRPGPAREHTRPRVRARVRAPCAVRRVLARTWMTQRAGGAGRAVERTRGNNVERLPIE